jgi:hypothetical protein
LGKTTFIDQAQICHHQRSSKGEDRIGRFSSRWNLELPTPEELEVDRMVMAGWVSQR